MASSEAVYRLLGVMVLVCSFPFEGTSAVRVYGVTAGYQDLVSTTCSHTLHFDVCVSSLRSDPRSKTSDVKGLAAIALDLSIGEAKKTISYIDSLKSRADNTQNQSKRLSECMVEYSDALENLQEAIQALSKTSIDDVNELATTAMTDSETCKDGFEEVPNSHFPLADRNQYFDNLCGNFLAITTLLV
ncbi:unnamed protein product [Ilex paraguariensis]|uniref:Pectinesterase inhibitor domain-containing protein n=1 Tax=Ilex paraguariensis TaxID=185542 RepID=A0ABC8RE68_9AQUA